MKIVAYIILALTLAITISGMQGAVASPALRVDSTHFNINTLAGKLASVQSTPGLLVTLSSFLQQEADMSDLAANPTPNTAITPAYVLSSNLDGSTVTAPDVTVNQDTLAASQNEPTIAVDPNNANRLVAGSNDYVTRTWSCTVGGTPCSALGDGYSGTHYSNDGGQTWCCVATDPSHLGTLIPGVERLTGGIYDAGGVSTPFFLKHGKISFSRPRIGPTAPPQNLPLNKGGFGNQGRLHLGSSTIIR